MKFAIEMADMYDQPLHMAASVNEVCSKLSAIVVVYIVRIFLQSVASSVWNSELLHL